MPEEKRTDIQTWISDLEYSILGIPKPDIVFFLDMPPNNARKLIALKEPRSYTDKAEDLHEASGDHLQKALTVFRHLANKNSWRRIECTEDDGVVRTPGVVHDAIMASLRQSFEV